MSKKIIRYHYFPVFLTYIYMGMQYTGTHSTLSSPGKTHIREVCERLKAKINTCSSQSQGVKSKLSSVQTNSLECLKSVLSTEAFCCLERVKICHDLEVESLSEAEEHLSAMDSLDLCNLPNLYLGNAREGQEDDGILWHCLHQSLHSYTKIHLPQIVNLPKGMCYLTYLVSLQISLCKGLEALRESLRELFFVVQHKIRFCSMDLIEILERKGG
ncbi:hypothetical protein Cgig2_026400 [Carnegiea gigantea]|uniref:Uncharacterized protein n=1 Tax=Carnegiea gigantea TaxID=171969 RepID=A0A9Q1K203_9CARY|nr:hypothetical protein Cgig2_026400 [Carnegiea gigantea]